MIRTDYVDVFLSILSVDFCNSYESLKHADKPSFIEMVCILVKSFFYFDKALEKTFSKEELIRKFNTDVNFLAHLLYCHYCVPLKIKYAEHMFS